MDKERYSRPLTVWPLLTIMITAVMMTFLATTASSEGLGSNCTNPESCSNVLTECVNGTCICKADYTPNTRKLICMAGYNEYCTVESIGGGCVDSNALCFVTGSTKRCLCQKTYTFDQKKGICVGQGTIAEMSLLALAVAVILNTTI